MAETTGGRNSDGFRRARSPADAIDPCLNVFGRQDRAPWIFEGALAACVDALRPDWLRAHIPSEKAMPRQWLTAGCRARAVWQATEAGSPQGSPLSPVRAHSALDGLESRLREHCPPTSRSGQHAKVPRWRSAEDWCIPGASQALLAQAVRPLVAQFRRARGLRLARENTSMTQIEAGVDFLGHPRRQ